MRVTLLSVWVSVFRFAAVTKWIGMRVCLLHVNMSISQCYITGIVKIL